QGVKLDRVAYCPHAPEDDCICRKPKPGMLLDAATELDIDLTQSVMIGDNVTDIEAGENAGCRLSLYLNSREHIDLQPAIDSLAEAIEFMLQ
ncbi:MAG: HAD-IIIA family hydrolase, partial [Candidatus Hydrogenedentota bacterium]